MTKFFFPKMNDRVRIWCNARMQIEGFEESCFLMHKQIFSTQAHALKTHFLQQTFYKGKRKIPNFIAYMTFDTYMIRK